MSLNVVVVAAVSKRRAVLAALAARSLPINRCAILRLRAYRIATERREQGLWRHGNCKATPGSQV